ncbi:Bystin-domain-containing protein [Syncephalis pseudoplumigaleata]|uniref:Bystin n=1 Tax=Syncephalis pseudoplumigaleata TaxID=1712513 RepID=A0A4P9Z491_9FUNG|nr:Bystin-domain-containing protein [Syncephalis pseudoplumigaleata]|eukprot:RKP27238.1 Bystin-domain-containing protein [Syncephalis pseudoplumigaleata]
MGKERTATVKHAHRHTPLHKEYMPSSDEAFNKGASRKKYAEREDRRRKKETAYIDPKLSKKILSIAREQQDELGREDAVEEEGDDQAAEEEEIYDDVSYDEFAEELELDAGDQEMLDRFLPSALTQRRNLADIVMDKIRQHEETRNRPANADERTIPPGLNPKVVEVYTQVGKLLSRYKSGKLPKAFKIIPSLPNWDEILYLTRPESWTPHSIFQATRIFVSNLKPHQSQKFFTYILLERVREDIRETKKLNYHLYMALKKALYRPAAFFKGILFPLCESGTCTLREAAIIGSVLAKVSVPVLHSSAALMHLANMEYTVGPNSLFMRILIDKKYALPYKVVDAVVFHFVRFKSETRALPVLWHQAFLTFCQRYKQDLTPEQKDALMQVLRCHTHHQITAEIRREIVHSTCRGEIINTDTAMNDYSNNGNGNGNGNAMMMD